MKGTLQKQNLDVAQLAEQLTRAGGVVVADGLAPGRVVRDASEMRDELLTRGHLLLVLDAHSPDSAEQTFDALLSAYELAVDRRVGLPVEALRLIEGLSARRRGANAVVPNNASRAVRFEAVGRLWTLLSHQVPAVLFVANVGSLEASDRALLEFLTQNVFSDPIGRLAPETRSWETARGAILFAPEAPAFVPDGTTTLDYHAETERAVRSLLESDEVVRQFARASGGDVNELARLVERLPEATTPIRLIAAQRLGEDVLTLLRLAAIADASVTPDLLGGAYERLFGSALYASALRKLCGDGFLKRTMGDGTVLVHIEDVALAGALRDDTDQDVATAMHTSLAETAMAEGGHEPAFIARHLLGAGLVAEAAPWALKAGRRALERDAIEEAIQHYRAATDDVVDHVLRCEAFSELIDAQAAAGELESALAHCDTLAELLDDDDARASLTVRTAQLLAQFGTNAEALQLFDEALARDLAPAVMYDAVIGKADLLYATATYDRARELAEEHLVTLEERCRASNDRTIHSAALRLRNLLGKIAIFDGRLDDAESIFERNAEEASRWSWDDELSRAHGNLGIVAMQRGDDADSLARLLSALETVGASGGLPRAYCLINLATVFQKGDRYDEALEHCLEGLRCAKRINDRLAYRSAANNLASIYHDLGAHQRAWAIFEHLEDVQNEAVDLFSKHLSTLARANLLLEQGDAEQAIAMFEELSHDDVPRFVSAQAALRLTEAHVELEQWESAARRLETVERADGWRAHWTLFDAALAHHEGDFERAADLTRTALEELPKNAAVKARLLRARALGEMGRTKEARQTLLDGTRTVLAALDRVPVAFHKDYVTKPHHRDLFHAAREAGVEVAPRVARWLDAEDETIPEAVNRDEFNAWRARYEDIVGDDPRLHQIFRMVDRVAASDATVLIHGESGTGKELVASAMHEQSDRAQQPFVKVNCAAFVENLLLSELFGHEKGAFTGAVSQKEGRFSRADGGTIFLDEIGDISPNTQVALLRVLQEGTFERVGGSQTTSVDVRVVCATNKNLEELVERGEFRLDLYYRLKGVVIEMPALRDRRGDIPRLAQHFARSFTTTGKPPAFAPEVLQFLASYSWPGNIRELQNFVKSILLFAEGDHVTMEQIEEFREFFSSGQIDASLAPIDLEEDVVDLEVALDARGDDDAEHYFADPEEALVEQLVSAGGSLSDLKKRLEIECIKRALIETEGNVTRAAEILQMKRPRLSQIINGTDELVELKQQLVS